MCSKPLICTLFYYYLLWYAEGFANIVFPCITPNGEEAYCVSIFSCPSLMKALGSQDQSAINFVRASVCCGCIPGDMLVCCGTASNFIDRTRPKNSTIQQHVTSPKPSITTSRATQATKTQSSTTQRTIGLREQKRNLLPPRTYCGYQHTDDRSYQDNATALDEFPWLVHVIYLEEEDDELDMYLDRCNGVLISNRYVLTTADCAPDVTKVRLGQYNTDKSIACIEDPDIPECSEPWIDIGVEEQIHRYDYNKDPTNTGHNFVLFRLNQSVPFSDYVRPICLPLEESVKADLNQSFYFSGWGALNRNMVEKKRLIYNLTSVDDCHKVDKDLNANSVNISLMCLKPGRENIDFTCQGDEAGPLMYQQNHQWFAEGIVVKVYFDRDSDERCSKTHPIAVARITPKIIDWILDSIRNG